MAQVLTTTATVFQTNANSLTVTVMESMIRLILQTAQVQTATLTVRLTNVKWLMVTVTVTVFLMLAKHSTTVTATESLMNVKHSLTGMGMEFPIYARV